MTFKNREQAGHMLAQKLAHYADRDDVMVLGLPRGGVPIAYEIAVALHAPLDVFLSRKLGAPGQEEFAMGAISSGGIRVINWKAVEALGISERELEAVTARERAELERREQAYRDNRSAPGLKGRTVIMVDDGVATGASMQAAIVALRQLQPARIVVAVPVAPYSAIAALRSVAEEVVCVVTPDFFYGVGQFYEDFSQLTDEEVRDFLTQARESLTCSRREVLAEEKR